MESLTNNNSNKKHSVLKIIFNREFVVSAIIPVLIFTVFDKMGMTLNGIILSGIWSIGVVVLNFVKERQFNAIAAMGAIFAAVGVIGTVVSKNPTFYLVAPIVQDILMAVIFFGSLFFKRSFFQIVVEQSYFKDAPEEFKKQPKYSAAWRIVTIAWGILSLSQAALRTILLYSVSIGSYYAISTFYGNISTPLLIAFSVLFPKWYWKREK